MKSLTKLGALVLPLALITGCASAPQQITLADISDFDKVKDHFTKVETHLKQVENTADIALTTARSAQASADEAHAKVDRMFHKAMSK